MQILLGKAGPWSKTEFDHALASLESTYGQTCRALPWGDAGFALLMTAEDSAVAGTAEDGDVLVVLHGVVHKPLMGWTAEAAPVDDPDAVAAHILSLYREHGEAMLRGISGSYACCILDRRDNRGLLFTDSDGMRNLYVCREGEGLWFGTIPRALAKAMPQGASVDRELEEFFLAFGFYPFNRTMYSGVEILAADSCAAIGRGSAIRPKPVAEVTAPFPWDDADESQAVQALYERFMQAVEDQCTGQKRVGVLLGGVDSALIASALKRLGKDVETYSFFYEASRFNQPHTDTLAEFIGSRHHWVPISPEVIAEGHRRYADWFCQPTNWANYPVQTAHVCEQMKRDGISHVYTGDGCDSVFMGYPGVYRKNSLVGRVRSLPPWVLSAALYLLKCPLAERVTGRLYTVVCGLLRSLMRPDISKEFLTFNILDPYSIHRLRREEGGPAGPDLEAIVGSLAESMGEWSSFRVSYAGKNFVSPNKTKMNGCMDRFGMVLLSPYLHSGLRSFARSIPDHYLRPQGQDPAKARIGKYLLLKMTEQHGFLPEEIIYQKKIAAVDGPVDAWYGAELRETVSGVLEGLPFAADRGYIDFLFADHPADRVYRRKISSDEITSHALSLLATYASFTEGFPAFR